MKTVPPVKFKLRTRNVDSGEFDWTYPTTEDYFKDKRVVVFSLPGAFTPTCSNNQVPGFDVLYDQIIESDVDEVYCIACNDTFVMNAWAEDLRVKNVKFIPDGSCEFTAGMNMLVRKDNLGFGARSWRYAMVVDNGIVERMFVEDGKEDDCGTDPYGETTPEKVLAYLQSGVETL
jgi:peroxiredoxin|tara:strand:+ start:2431 stop:2955 length:525 start_codon:yes stop_codon:yes gene_type:complete